MPKAGPDAPLDLGEPLERRDAEARDAALGPNNEPSHRRGRAGLSVPQRDAEVEHRAADADRSEPDAAHHCDRWWWPDDHRGAAHLDGLERHGSAQEPDRVEVEPQRAQGPERQRLRALELLP